MINPSGKHILIVDVYADAVDIWAIYLQSRGYRVSTAADGPTALEKAITLLPDLIILDLELPGLTGFEVAQGLRAKPDTSGIPLIAATGYSHARQLDLARQSGFDAVLVKPCDPDMLVQEIERLLASGPLGAQPDHSGVQQPYNNR
jgi:two-component system, cell cycle response regulator DivK